MKKLNQLGFSHELILVAFVAIFAIGGVAYKVSSSAGTYCVNKNYGLKSKGKCVSYAQELANHKSVVKPS